MKTRFIERPYNADFSQKLAEVGILRPIARALSARGVNSFDDLREDWAQLINPVSMTGIDTAVSLLADAREHHRHITIVADYDCDGATACAVALKGFSMMGIDANYIIPDRFRLGYGLSPEVVDICAEQDPRPEIILTVDNGIANIRGVAHARELGIDVIVTDHHLAGDTLPEANCIVNPNVPGNTFTSKSLAGCGVMFYVLLALRAELRRRGIYTKETQPRLDTLSDLVALGTIADVVKLDKNNRILVSQGLKRIRTGFANKGINAILRTSKKDPRAATARDIAFSIAPRINAAGRLADMGLGIDCLLAEDEALAQEMAKKLDALNTERRELEGTMQLDALEIVRHIDMTKKTSLALYDCSWQQGVVGLVASRVKDKINRPVIAFAPDEGEFLKGSGRSIDGIHLRDVLDTISKRDPNLIVRFGGHAMAAGLTIHEKDFERFAHLFETVVSELTEPETFEKKVYIDGVLNPEEITFTLVDALNSRIWGQGFEQPIFANDFTIFTQKVLKEAHLKLTVGIGERRFDAIYFRRNTPLPSRARLAYRPEINEFLGRRTLQLVITDWENA